LFVDNLLFGSWINGICNESCLKQRRYIKMNMIKVGDDTGAVMDVIISGRKKMERRWKMD